jgi:hypothetical protein
MRVLPAAVNFSVLWEAVDRSLEGADSRRKEAESSSAVAWPTWVVGNVMSVSDVLCGRHIVLCPTFGFCVATGYCRMGHSCTKHCQYEDQQQQLCTVC